MRARGVTRTLWVERDRADLRRRLARLSPAARPLWGRFTAPQMVAHLADAARLALGEIDARPRRGGVGLRLLRLPFVASLAIRVAPFPRHAPAPREILVSRPGDWTRDLATLDDLQERVAERARASDPGWPEHPYFGRLSTRSWGILGYKHADHHLRQFGV